MRQIPLVIFSILSLVSCQRNSGSGGSSPVLSTGNRLVSIKGYGANVLNRVDSFLYNADGSFSTQYEVNIGGGANRTNDSLMVSFVYGSQGGDPVSYILSNSKGTATYSVSYDSLGRLSKDTAYPDPAGRSADFSYPDNNFAYISTTDRLIDTFYISNENVLQADMELVPYNPNNSARTLFSYQQVYPNPFYTVCQTANARMLLTKIDNWEFYANDFISKDMCTSYEETIFPGSSQKVVSSLTYTFSTNASGQIVSLSVGDQSVYFFYGNH